MSDNKDMVIEGLQQMLNDVTNRELQLRVSLNTALKMNRELNEKIKVLTKGSEKTEEPKAPSLEELNAKMKKIKPKKNKAE